MSSTLNLAYSALTPHLFRTSNKYPSFPTLEVLSDIQKKWHSLGGEHGFLGSPKGKEKNTPKRTGRYRHFEGGSIYWSPETGAHEIHGLIRKRWSQLRREQGILGYPTTDELPTVDQIGRFNHFQGGSIFWSPNTGAHEVHGSIRDKWASHNWEQGFLGYPTTGERKSSDKVGRFNHFERGSIFWSPNTGAHAVTGAIRNKWFNHKRERGFLGYPITDELPTTDTIGRFNHFEGGSIYWSPNTGAHAVTGAIRNKWAYHGWETSFLGYPVTDELTTPDKIGRFNHFERGSIYWSPNTGAHEVHGAIRNKWAHYGWEKSFLGYPVTDELPTADTIGRYNHFEGGSIYWSPNTGAHEVHGAIRDKWASHNWERGFLGYPVTDELPTADTVGRYNHFEGGSIYWSPNTGAHEVHGVIRDKWASQGWERGALGYPMTDELIAPHGGRYSIFENGVLYWTPYTGADFAQYHDVSSSVVINAVDDAVLAANKRLKKTGNTTVTEVHKWYEHQGIRHHKVLELDMDLKYSRKGIDPGIDLDLFIAFEAMNGAVEAKVINIEYDVKFPRWLGHLTFGVGRAIMNSVGRNQLGSKVSPLIGKSFAFPQNSNTFVFAAQPQENGSIRAFGTLA